jgi:hypothetical protein
MRALDDLLNREETAKELDHPALAAGELPPFSPQPSPVAQLVGVLLPGGEDFAGADHQLVGGVELYHSKSHGLSLVQMQLGGHNFQVKRPIGEPDCEDRVAPFYFGFPSLEQDARLGRVGGVKRRTIWG